LFLIRQAKNAVGEQYLQAFCTLSLIALPAFGDAQIDAAQ
jgi:hypothetical protein